MNLNFDEAMGLALVGIVVALLLVVGGVVWWLI